jgi:hypothetical protein
LSKVKQSEVTADQIGHDGSTVKEAILKTWLKWLFKSCFQELLLPEAEEHKVLKVNRVAGYGQGQQK